MSNLYREPSIDASYQVSVHLAKRFHKRIFFRNQPIRNKNSVAAMFDSGSELNEQSLQRIFQGCFLPSFDSFGSVVSEEEILKNRPIRNKNCLWRPCLLMYRDKMSNVQRGPCIDASYLVSVHLAEGFESRRLTDDGRQVMAKVHIAFGKVN